MKPISTCIQCAKPVARFVILLLGGFVATQLGAVAQIVSISNLNSLASINLGSQSGMYNWTIDGQNQLNQQWFWYRIGNVNAEASIDTIGLPTYSVSSGGRQLTTLYTGVGFSIQIDYLLTGGSIGSGVSDIGESIRIRNLTGDPLDFHFYQYSDFDLGGPGNDVVQLGKNLQGKFNEAAQSDGLVGMTETVVTPGANRGEAKTQGLTLGELNDGLPTLLDGSGFASPVGPGNVTWAFEWDFTVAANGSFLISKDKYIQIQNIPEPATVALLGLGGLILIRRFKR